MAPSATGRPSRAASQANRATRTTRTKPAISYAEPDSDAESEDNPSLEDSDSEVDMPTRPSRSRTVPKPQAAVKRQRPSSKPIHGLESRPRTKKPKLSAPQSAEVWSPLISSGVIPKWQSLPYHILVQVFHFATYPLYNDQFQSLNSPRWLVNVGRLCRGFAEPALTVLYTNPPLVPMVQAHQLVDLLKADPKRMAYKYRQKVETLRIEVVQTAAYTLSGSGILDLEGLIKDLPRLKDLEFYHLLDMMPYRSLDVKIKWTYPEAIFEALEYVDPAADPHRGDKTSVCQLQSWRWSSRLAGKAWALEKIPELHLKPYFANLRKVSFVNYQVPLQKKKDEEDPKHENLLAEALNNLKSLQHLIFESSTLVNHKLLPMLPRNLRHLELINCWEVVAEDFGAFLLTHGNQLRYLILNHNQSLSLSFLPVLGDACPRLQVLRMNLVYFNLHATYHDSEPQYKQLLFPGEVPVWPSTLQTIELIQMRKWETEAAEMFFQSLLDSAGSLPDLRKLSIQAILNIGWRDRASFRDKWVGSLERVFKRAWSPPKVHTTLRLAAVEDAKVQVVVNKKDPLQTIDFDCCTTLTGEEEGSPLEASSTHLPIRKSPRSVTKSSPMEQRAVSPESKEKKPRKRISDASTSQETDAASSPSSRRTTRRSAKRVSYAESDDEPEPAAEAEAEHSSSSTTGKKPKRNGASRELLQLKDSIGFHGSFAIAPEAPEDVDNDYAGVLIKSPEKGNGKGKEKAKEVIQGMCEIVEIRIDNLRPTELQVTEADFLDEEKSGDDDWDGDIEEDEVWGSRNK